MRRSMPSNRQDVQTSSMSSSSRPQTDRLDQEGFSPPSFTQRSARTGAHVDQKNETADDRYMHTEKSVDMTASIEESKRTERLEEVVSGWDVSGCYIATT